jgi:hypothetical protein
MGQDQVRGNSRKGLHPDIRLNLFIHSLLSEQSDQKPAPAGARLPGTR